MRGRALIAPHCARGAKLGGRLASAPDLRPLQLCPRWNDKRFFRGAGGNPFANFGFAQDPFNQGGGSQGSGDDRLYGLLEVDKAASEADIKKAYKKQAMKHHPDRGGDEAKFKDITRAYEVLSNAEKRQIYDQYGEQGLENMEQGGGGGPNMGADPFDLFSQMFGFSPGRNGRRNGRMRTEDAIHELAVSLEDLYNGTSRDIAYNRDVICSDCNGDGGHSKETCKVCNGAGVKVEVVQMGPFVQQVQRVCDNCGGKGTKIAKGSTCKTCSGKGTVRQKQRFSVNVNKGALDGTEFRFAGKADEIPGYETGDVVIVLKEKAHDTFHRLDNDLVMSKKLPLVDALCGFRFTIRHLNGEDLTISSGPGDVVKPGEPWQMPGKGMPRSDGSGRFGALNVVFKVEFPSSMPAEDQQKLSQVLGGPPREPFSEATAKKLSAASQRQLEERLQHQSQKRSQRGGGSVQCAQQ